jgi:hypothetical protein
MTDPIQDVLAPAAVERALEIYRQMRDCDHAELVQTRKVATDRVFALIDSGERDEQALVIGALAHIKALERARAKMDAKVDKAERARHHEAKTVPDVDAEAVPARTTSSAKT